ncbi:TetR/AcrR family transcriptional regulator [Pseudomonas sp. 5P_5.1_Bac1]|uniref:TetR/AcrR family transcriptional regulator n=1 Tax=Pseudomonas sp. 5P_5.1_Bac1 TaxID=2971616 RepID=UPI0021C6180D|nr:TetR/AcrR family transcriptional regulator [Pseudomonas sp. 5P_5.1_Bac1]MCU1720366.1 TetR/AcrR family transcriptional regulator [Pseudomonas sp. 5P_5.1_Bac1]
MRTLSPSAEKICGVAVGQFAESGYDAASLNDIAVAVGMRKPSLYAHFNSKDDLFEAVFERALEAERIYVEGCFAADRGLPGALYAERLAERYQESAHLRFLLRAAFFPPAELRPMISAGFEGYLARMGEFFGKALQRQLPKLDEERRALFVDAYLGVVDSLIVELIYAGQAAYERRLKAMWTIFAGSLQVAM